MLWPTLWQTPRVGAHGQLGNHPGAMDALEPQAMLWATPTSPPQTHDPRQVDHGEQLANQVDQWPTPNATDWKGASSRTPGKDRPPADDDLPTRVSRLGRQAPRSGIGGPTSSPDGPNSRQLWATPNAADGTGGHHPSEVSAERGGNRTLNRNLQEMGCLNPLFVTWLMGLPLGWVNVQSNCAPSATPAFPPRRPTPS